MNTQRFYLIVEPEYYNQALQIEKGEEYKETNDEQSISDDDYSLNDEDKTLSINNTFIEPGNYKILINNKKLSYDSLEYNLTIYETIKLEKKYIFLYKHI